MSMKTMTGRPDILTTAAEYVGVTIIVGLNEVLMGESSAPPTKNISKTRNKPLILCILN